MNMDQRYAGRSTGQRTLKDAIIAAENMVRIGGKRPDLGDAVLSWSMFKQVGSEYHFEIEGKWGVKKWFRIPEGLYRELMAFRTDSPLVFADYSGQIRRFFEQSPWPGPAKNVEAEFKPENLGNWFYKKIVGWSKSLPKGHATTHIFRKTSLQYARLGEDVNRQVAQDARLGEEVMITHYV